MVVDGDWGQREAQEDFGGDRYVHHLDCSDEFKGVTC